MRGGIDISWHARRCKDGPLRTDRPSPIAAVQLHQTGRSSIAQHFRRMKAGSADFALFNRAVDSKLRRCDLVRLKVADVYASG